MKENLIILWKEAGFDYVEFLDGEIYVRDGMYYSLGTREIEIQKDGGFYAYENSIHEGGSPVIFTSEMTKALINSIKYLQENKNK